MKFRVLLLVVVLLIFGLRSADAAVDLNYLRAAALSDGTIEIEWRTGSEQDTAGFSLKRSTTPPDNAFISDTTGPFIEVIEDGTSSPTDFINARGSTVAGDTYTVIDENVVAGQTYYYLLVETVISGGRTPYGENIANATVGDGNSGGQLPTPVTPTTQSSTPTVQPTDTQEPTSTTAAGQPTSTPRPTNTPLPTNTAAATATATTASDDDSTPAPTATSGRVFITPTTQEQANTPVPTDTQEPTDTPAPTDTAEPTSTTAAGQPTSTPRPTNTLPPTSTPRPTNTPPPTSLPSSTTSEDASGGGGDVATPDVAATATSEQVAVVPDDSSNPPVAEAQDDESYPVNETGDVEAPVDNTDGGTEEVYVEPVATVGAIGSGEGSAETIGNEPIPLTTPLPTTAQEEGGVNPLLWLVFGAGVLVFGAGVVGSILIFTRKQDNV